MEKVISKVSALGVPGIVLVVAINATGLAGGAAIVAALAALGPGGIIGGIATLGIIGLVSQGLTEYGFEAIFCAVVKELYKNGESKNSILSKIEKYPISNSLKRKIRDTLNEV